MCKLCQTSDRSWFTMAEILSLNIFLVLAETRAPQRPARPLRTVAPAQSVVGPCKRLPSPSIV